MSLQVWLPLTGNIMNQGLAEITTAASGATVNTSGKLGSCYSFDGSDDYISLTGQCFYDIIKGGTQPFSIALWLYRADATRAILFGDYSLAGAINFNLELTTAHQVRFYWNSSPDYSAPNTFVTASAWTHVAITYDGSNLKFYINGTLTNTRSGALSAKTKTSGSYYLGRDSRTGTTVLNGRMNDFRLYDHCLSVKEVRELAKGLVLHYKLDDPYVESTTNLVPIPVDTGAANYAWDASLHAGARTVSGWGGGYNGGVGTPASGYHACWRIIENRPTMVYQNINSDYGMTGRWLGISSTACYPAINAGETYTISFEMMTVGKRQASFPYVFGGWYYKLTSSASSRSFHDGYFYLSNTKIGAWEKVSVVKTRASGFDNNSDYQAFYIYGQSSTEGIMYVRNVQVEKKDHATPYTGEAATSQNGMLVVYDSSGYGYNGALTSGRVLKMTSDSPRYALSTTFPRYGENGQCVDMTNTALLPAITSGTVSWWVKYTSTQNLLLTGNNDIYYYLAASQNNAYYNSRITVGTWYVDGLPVSSAPKPVTGAWHMYTVTGVDFTGWTTFRLNRYDGSNAWSLNGSLSDFRIYATSLSAADVLELYHTEAAVGRGGEVFAREVIER